MTIRLIILITIFFIVLGWALGRASAMVPLKEAKSLTAKEFAGPVPDYCEVK